MLLTVLCRLQPVSCRCAKRFPSGNSYFLHLESKMKKILLATTVLLATGSSAFAADLAVKAHYSEPSSVWNWTGFYGGVHAGAGWGTTESTLTSISAPGFPA